MKIVVMDQDIFAGEYIPYLGSLEPLKAMGCEFTAYPGAPAPSMEERYERIKNADIVVFGLYEIPNEILEKCKNLKAVAFFGVGYQSMIDEAYCQSRGIPIFNTPNYGMNTVAEYAVGLAMALCRKTCMADRRWRSGVWSQDGLEGREIRGQTFGVAGTGAIGSLVAEKAHLLGANVIAHDLYPSERLIKEYGIKYVSLEELFATSDIVSLHLAIHPSTNGIVTKALIGSMKNDAIFINTARSSVMQDEYAHVLKRIKDGTLYGAAMDVFDEEPVPDWADYGFDNVIATPHIGYLTGNAMGNTLVIACERIAAFLKNR